MSAVANLSSAAPVWQGQIQVVRRHTPDLPADFDSLDGRIELVHGFVHRVVAGAIDAIDAIHAVGCDAQGRLPPTAESKRRDVGDAQRGWKSVLAVDPDSRFEIAAGKMASLEAEMRDAGIWPGPIPRESSVGASAARALDGAQAEAVTALLCEFDRFIEALAAQEPA